MILEAGNSEDDPDLKMPLTTEETEIRSYLMNEGILSEETIAEYLQPFWCEEPYKYVYSNDIFN